MRLQDPKRLSDSFLMLRWFGRRAHRAAERIAAQGVSGCGHGRQPARAHKAVPPPPSSEFTASTIVPRAAVAILAVAVLGGAASALRMACPLARVFPLNSSTVSALAKHGITISPLTPLGAAVRGVDLRKKPAEPVLEELQSAMAVRGFLVFKDQGVLSGDEQVAASEYWGGREIHSTHGVHPEAPNDHIFRLSNDQRRGILGVGPQWHNDGSFIRGVFSHVGYHIIKVAEGGGGTIFAHQGAAFDALSEGEQERWQRLVSVNSNSGHLHPMVHKHPISGRKSVFLHLGMTGAVFEVTPKAEGAKPAHKLRLLEEQEMRHLFQSYNALLNKGFAPGTADSLGAVPCYGTPVKLSGLQAAEFNGRKGIVDGVLDRRNGKVAVLLEGEPAKRIAVKPDNLAVLSADGDAADEAGRAYTMNYQYEDGDCIFIDNLAIAHRASPEAHLPHTQVGLRILHRTTVKSMVDFDPPFELPPQLNIQGPNPVGQGVWEGGGLGFRWDETIPMQN